MEAFYIGRNCFNTAKEVTFLKSILLKVETTNIGWNEYSFEHPGLSFHLIPYAPPMKVIFFCVFLNTCLLWVNFRNVQSNLINLAQVFEPWRWQELSVKFYVFFFRQPILGMIAGFTDLTFFHYLTSTRTHPAIIYTIYSPLTSTTQSPTCSRLGVLESFEVRRRFSPKK